MREKTCKSLLKIDKTKRIRTQGNSGGEDPQILKRGGALCRPKKKILRFRWSKKAKITLETISFWQNISISIFKFSPFLYAMKACQ